MAIKVINPSIEQLPFYGDSYIKKGKDFQWADSKAPIYKDGKVIAYLYSFADISKEVAEFGIYNTGDEFWKCVFSSKDFSFDAVTNHSLLRAIINSLFKAPYKVDIGIDLSKYTPANFSNIKEAYNSLLEELKTSGYEIRV